MPSAEFQVCNNDVCMYQCTYVQHSACFLLSRQLLLQLLSYTVLLTGVDTMSTADVLAELAYLNPRNKRKGKGGRQPAMDPRLDPNVDPKKAKRILANRLSAARSKMKQKSHVEVSSHTHTHKCICQPVKLPNSSPKVLAAMTGMFFHVPAL